MSGEQPVRVLLVDTYPGAFLGAQRTMLELAAAPGLDAVVLLVADGPVADRFRAAGVPVEICPYPPRLASYGGGHLRQGVVGKTLSAWSLVTHNLRVRRIVRRSGAQVVYCSNTRSVLSTGLGARLARRPVVWYVQQLERSFGAADRVAAALSTRIATISPRTDRLFPPGRRGRVQRRLRSVPLGIEVGPLPVRPARPSSTVTIAVIGAVTELKGVDRVVDAFVAVHTRLDARLLVIGGPVDERDAHYLQRMQQRVAVAGADGSVEWLGWRDDVRELLSGVDVVVSASRREGLPRSIMEAMAAGAAVVATDVGAVADLVRDGETGLLVPVDDPVALTAAVERLVADGDERRRLAAAARRLVEQSFDHRRWMAEFEALLREVAT